VRLKSIPPPSTELLLFPESDTDFVHFEDVQNHPFDHAAKSFSRVNAWWLAEAALLAYWDEAPARLIWRRAGLESAFFSDEGVQCHVAWADEFIIVAFRGVQPDDWHDLLDIARTEHHPWEFGGGVHEGFLAAHERIWGELATKLEDLDPNRRTVWFTGHSLGAAVATLSMDRFGRARGLYTFGSPPVGNRRFATAFDRRHGTRSFRYVNHRDSVAHLPGWLSLFVGSYVQIKLRMYIDRHGAISTRSPSLATRLALLRIRRLPREVMDNLDAVGLLPEGFVDHTPRRYAVHTWNDYAARQPKAVAAPV
jgi:triacylglycerol lipase